MSVMQNNVSLLAINHIIPQEEYKTGLTKNNDGGRQKKPEPVLVTVTAKALPVVNVMGDDGNTRL